MPLLWGGTNCGALQAPELFYRHWCELVPTWFHVLPLPNPVFLPPLSWEYSYNKPLEADSLSCDVLLGFCNISQRHLVVSDICVVCISVCDFDNKWGKELFEIKENDKTNLLKEFMIPQENHNWEQILWRICGLVSVGLQHLRACTESCWWWWAEPYDGLS